MSKCIGDVTRARRGALSRRYPVVFIFSEGTGDWSPNFEIMIYGVLDILSKAVFGFILLLSHEGLDRITNFKRWACVRACMRACVRACVHACVRVCDKYTCM